MKKSKKRFVNFVKCPIKKQTVKSANFGKTLTPEEKELLLSMQGQAQVPTKPIKITSDMKPKGK